MESHYGHPGGDFRTGALTGKTHRCGGCAVSCCCLVSPDIWNLYTLNNGGAFMAPEPDDDDDETWVLFNVMNGNRAEMSPEAAGIAACLMTYSHHACRTECYAMTVHYYRLRDYALQHPECSAIMRIID